MSKLEIHMSLSYINVDFFINLSTKDHEYPPNEWKFRYRNINASKFNLVCTFDVLYPSTKDIRDRSDSFALNCRIATLKESERP